MSKIEKLAHWATVVATFVGVIALILTIREQSSAAAKSEEQFRLFRVAVESQVELQQQVLNDAKSRKSREAVTNGILEILTKDPANKTLRQALKEYSEANPDVSPTLLKQSVQMLTNQAFVLRSTKPNEMELNRVYWK